MADSLWIVRHGESVANAGGVTEGATSEVPLTKLGYRQARDVADRIQKCPDRLVTSPFLRARQTAVPVLNRWRFVPFEVWPIGEFTYLAPARVRGTTRAERVPLVEEYWDRCDPSYVDGEGAESFSAFMERVEEFAVRITDRPGWTVAVGHGQFFGAYQLGCEQGFQVTPEFMRLLRQRILTAEIGNGHIIKMHPRKATVRPTIRTYYPGTQASA